MPEVAGEPGTGGERPIGLRALVQSNRHAAGPLRQIVESVNDTLKGQLDLERHGGRTPAGVCARIAQRVLALTNAIWHNDALGLNRRSLLAYDH